MATIRQGCVTKACVLLALAAAACGGQTSGGEEQPGRYRCRGTFVENGEPLGAYPDDLNPDDEPPTICALASQTTPDERVAACNAECGTRIAEYEQFAGATCQTQRADLIVGGRPCQAASIPFLYGGPAQFVAAVSGGIHVHIDNAEGPFAGSGDGDSTFASIVHYSVEPPEGPCPTGGCRLLLTALRADVANFDVEIDLTDPLGTTDVPVNNMNVTNFDWVRGAWNEDGTFSIPQNSLRVLVSANVDGDDQLSVSPNSNAVTGTLNRETGAITFDPFAVTGSEGATTVTVGPATLLQSRPTAVIAPASPIECNAPRVAHVTLDAGNSTDPDNDLNSFRWFVNGGGALYGETVPVTLAFDSPNSIELRASDVRLAHDVATSTIDVVDTTAPELITPTVDVVEVCTPKPQAVAVPVPTVNEICTPDNVTLTGTVIGVDRQSVDPIPVVGGQALLPLGEHTVRWDVVDESGNPNSLEDIFRVTQIADNSCCAAGQQLLEGGDGNDVIIPHEELAYCVLSFGAHDVVQTMSLGDSIFGGEGDDRLRGGGGFDLLLGGEGSDVIKGGHDGRLEAYGEAGDDTLECQLADICELYGGFGDDLLIGGAGGDLLFPGPGADTVLAGRGDDRVVLLNTCELDSGTVLNGGAGFDTLVIPATLAELQALGIVVHGFEEIIVDDSQEHLSDCF